jgi:hypothetical protein
MKNIRLGDQGAARVAPAPVLQQDKMVTGITLEYLARRIEGANGDSPNLISAASSLVPDAEGSERERARMAVDRILRPMALEALGTSLGRNGTDVYAANGAARNGRDSLEEHTSEPERRS